MFRCSNVLLLAVHCQVYTAQNRVLGQYLLLNWCSTKRANMGVIQVKKKRIKGVTSTIRRVVGFFCIFA